jgi:predicted small secreted protein
MRKILIAFVMSASLAGCATFQTDWNAITSVVGSTVSPTAVYVARNSFDALEVTATNYIVFCKRNPATVGCSKTAIAKLIPAVRAGRVARTNLVQFQKDHPGQLGTSGLYDALVAATNTLQGIANQYQIAGVVQ